MTLVLLVRHADTPVAGKVLTGWSRGIHLNERGLEQADALVERLEPVPIAAVYSSPLERCRETAAPLARARALEVRLRRALLEVDYGEWTNRSIRQLARTKRWQAVQRTPSSFRFPGGESLRGVQARAVEAVRTIAEEHPDDAVMIVTHADVVRLVLAELAGIHLDLYQRLAVAPASVSAVALGDGQTRVLTVNDTGSLASLAPPPPVRRRRSPKVAG